MSVFHVFYLASDNKSSFEQVKKTIIDITPTVSPDIAKGRSQIYENTDEQFKIWCEYFSLAVTNGGKSVKYRSEDYGMNFKYQLWFDAYTVTPNWLEGILSFIGKIIKECDGDCVLESNGDTPIVMRKNGALIVDDKKLNGIHSIPFSELGIEYQVGDLVQV